MSHPHADPPDARPPGLPVLPADEALEEMEEAEAAEPAEWVGDGTEARPNNRTWAELDVREEMDRRFDLDLIAQVSQIVARHTRPAANEDDGEAWKNRGASGMPAALEDDFAKFLRQLIRTGTRLARRHR